MTHTRTVSSNPMLRSPVTKINHKVLPDDSANQALPVPFRHHL